jgi:hypothetical protein
LPSKRAFEALGKRASEKTRINGEDYETLTLSKKAFEALGKRYSGPQRYKFEALGKRAAAANIEQDEHLLKKYDGLFRTLYMLKVLSENDEDLKKIIMNIFLKN